MRPSKYFADANRPPAPGLAPETPGGRLLGAFVLGVWAALDLACWAGNAIERLGSAAFEWLRGRR